MQFNRKHKQFSLLLAACSALQLLAVAPEALAQSVCLPAPRLLTTKPMGGQTGTTFDVTITGNHLDDPGKLSFSHPGITAKPKLDKNGKPIPLQYVVTIAPDCPTGIHEAHVMSRLGISTARAFNVSDVPEVLQVKKNTTLETAMPLELNSICNAVMTNQAVDYFAFEAKQGERIVVDCAAKGIDSKLNPVLIVADANGADLQVQRRGGAVDFAVPEDGKYIIKVHDLTFQGGPYYFYRLALQKAEQDEIVPRLPAIETVSSFSWPPVGLSTHATQQEAEPNNEAAQAQEISLPCDIAGSFYPAADVDTFEFTAQKGDVWWVEVASERLGCPTDPSILVQHVAGEGGAEKRTDVAELSDIPTPVKVSSNHYSYDGPPYNAGSSDILGKLEIKQDGLHRLSLRDLFGATRNNPQNVYRLIIRKASPDFAVVGWALHMNLRNGDRNALSKPIALRGGTTMPLEVVVVRRDGFDGPIDLIMENLPKGVTAQGLTIPAGQSRGHMLITAQADAPQGLSYAHFYAQAEIAGKTVKRAARLASMQWPVSNAWSEIPAPRLLADIPVSVCDTELAPITIAPAEDKTWEVTTGETLTIPLVHSRRCDFSGANITLKTFGNGFTRVPAFDASLKADTSEAVIDLAKLKTKPGEYVIAFYGKAVAKYRYNLAALAKAEAALKQARQDAELLSEEVKNLAEVAKSAIEDEKAAAKKAADEAAARLKAAQAAVKSAEQAHKRAEAQAKPKDIVDIIVSKPITIHVNPQEKAK